MSEDLDEKIAKISSFKATEDQIQKKLSCNLKENLKLQCDRWAANKISSPHDISYLEVQLETLKSLKKEAISLSTRVEWTPSSLGISQLDLEQIIVEISQTLQEARRADRQKESKDKKICDQISSQGSPLALPKIHSPTDILSWMKVYKQVSKFVHSDLTKLALIKNSLSGKDKKSTEHLNSVGGVINFIHEKYCKGDMVLNILTRQAYDLQEPW